MGSVIKWPKHRHHGRASAGIACGIGRAAHDVIIKAEIPAWAARSVAKIGAHHSAGMLSRCHHLETAEAPAPMSDAMPSREGHSSITERNDVGSDMHRDLGHLVLKSKAILSCDCEQPVGENPRMADRMSETEEKLAFIRRVRTARMARFEKQNPILTILDIDQGKYKQYESRTPLPWRYIPKFCAACGVSMEWLLTGEGQGPAALVPLPSEAPKRRSKGLRRSRAA